MDDVQREKDERDKLAMAITASELNVSFHCSACGACRTITQQC